MLDRYNFVDLSVYVKGKNGYVNLTDEELDGESDVYPFQSKEKYLLRLCPFEREFCSVSIEELTRLAGIGDLNFKKRIEDETILAFICAKKIVNYNYGKIIRKGNNTFSFHRQIYVKKDGKQVRDYPLILVKTFSEVL